MFENRDQVRQMFFETWRKMQTRQQLSPVEELVAGVIQDHPEYHPLLNAPPEAASDLLPIAGEANPFLHMGLHIAVREQLTIGLPAGVREAHAALARKLQDPLATEHEMIECLAENLWQAQRDQRPPDEQAYVNCLKRRAGLSD